MPSSTTLADRLRDLALRVAEVENRLAKTPTLADAIFLASVDALLSQVGAVEQKKRRGRKAVWDEDRLALLLVLVEESKRRWHIRPRRGEDVEVLRRVVERWGLKRDQARKQVSELQKMLSKARRHKKVVR